MPAAKNPVNTRPLPQGIRAAIALVLSLACLWAIWYAGYRGISRLLTEYGGDMGQLALVERAVKMSPNDPDARTGRGLMFSQLGRYAEAVLEFESAAKLRPRDYYLWLELGMARDQAGDQSGSERALRESVRLAPYYARPAWQLGNVLFRLGRQDEAFEQFRRAAASQPALLPGIIDLAWGATRSAEGTRSAVRPQTSFAHLAMAGFFARHGNGTEAVTEFRAAGSVSRDDARELVKELLAQKAFGEAREIWAHEPGRNISGEGNSLIYDGGFEQSLEIDDPGFGWQVPLSTTVIVLSLDAADPYQGAQSLRIDFQGASNPATSVISQIILVEPNTRYRLRFATRMRDVVSGGLPLAVVADAAAPDIMLAKSTPFGSGVHPWSESSLEFTTGPQTKAVTVQIRRTPCTTEPCPIFGSLWLDGFALQKA
ncbi:MAG: tetratricopeptide repeat protein [Pyrinomonadaceae bacterium]